MTPPPKRRGGPRGKPRPPADPAAERAKLLALLGLAPDARLPAGGIAELAWLCGTSQASVRHRLYGRRKVPQKWLENAAYQKF